MTVASDHHAARLVSPSRTILIAESGCADCVFAGDEVVRIGLFWLSRFSGEF